jgi:hypothetical protein
MLGYATGVVHPIQGNWNLDGPVDISFADGKWQLHVRESRFHLFVSGEEPADLGTFRNEITSIVQGCMDALGFHLAAPLRTELSSFVIDGNRLMMSTNRWAELTNDPLKSSVSGAELAPFIQAATAEPLARLALADLRTAIEAPDDTPFLAYRAVESVRQWFLADQSEDEGSARVKSWQVMRDTLEIDEVSVRRLAVLARGRRHGGSQSPTGAEREEALRLSRAIVAAFVDHIHRAHPAEAG